jgi:hypothetical protein
MMAFRLLLAAAVIAAGAAVPAAQDVSQEYRVKAGFLYNFVKYVEWPEPITGPLRICVAGQNPFGTVLDDLVRNERVRGLALTTAVIPGPEPDCHVVFTPRTSNVRAYVTAAAGKPILTVGETGNFIELGGMIALTLDHGLVRFAINRPAAERVKLRISSRLLQLARLTDGSEER